MCVHQRNEKHEIKDKKCIDQYDSGIDMPRNYDDTQLYMQNGFY